VWWFGDEAIVEARSHGGVAAGRRRSLGWFGSGLGVVDAAVMLVYASTRPAAEPNQEDGSK
jgi:hypothetical protein